MIRAFNEQIRGFADRDPQPYISRAESSDLFIPTAQGNWGDMGSVRRYLLAACSPDLLEKRAWAPQQFIDNSALFNRPRGLPVLEDIAFGNPTQRPRRAWAGLLFYRLKSNIYFAQRLSRLIFGRRCEARDG